MGRNGNPDAINHPGMAGIPGSLSGYRSHQGSPPYRKMESKTNGPPKITPLLPTVRYVT